MRLSSRVRRLAVLNIGEVQKSKRDEVREAKLDARCHYWDRFSEGFYEFVSFNSSGTKKTFSYPVIRSNPSFTFRHSKDMEEARRAAREWAQK